jgi:YaiO family outer membrane protein
MAINTHIRHFFISGIILLSSHYSTAQNIDTSTATGLYQAARRAAFDSSDYPRAKTYLLSALKKSPNDVDARIFLGRIYTWTKNYDSARIAFRQALDKYPDYEDAFVAYADMEYYADQNQRSLDIIRQGLAINPSSEQLMFRQARQLNALGRTSEAKTALERLLLLHPANTEALALFNNISDVRKTAPPTTGVRTSSDDLLVAARKAAFDNKNYEQAKQLLYQALKQNPDYADVKIFLGRIHTWTNNPDSARYYFKSALANNPGYEDAAVAYADMEYWENNNAASLNVIETALKQHPLSEVLLFRKARALNAMRQYSAADSAIQQVLRINRNNPEARLLADRIKELSAANKIGISYDYVYFDKQFADPWHLVSLDYTRATSIGSITGRINYANRFRENGLQYELEAYPRISKTFYSYVNIGYSDKAGVFPQWRGGFSLYVNLPKSYEGELGFRYLKFSGDPTWIYTAYLGKYYKSWLFGVRTYLTPSSTVSAVSSSYNVSARYYYGSADDVIGFNVGYGISPDDRLNAIQLDNPVKLTSYKAGLSFKKKVSRFNVLAFDASYYNQEYLPNTKGNQYQLSIGWLHRF